MELHELRSRIRNLDDFGLDIIDSFNIFDYDKNLYVPWRNLTADEIRSITRAYESRSTLGQIKAMILAQAIQGESYLNLALFDSLDEWELQDLEARGYKVSYNEDNELEVRW